MEDSMLVKVSGLGSSRGAEWSGDIFSRVHRWALNQTKRNLFVFLALPLPRPPSARVCASGTLTAQLMAQLNVYFRRFRTAHKWQPFPVAEGDQNCGREGVSIGGRRSVGFPSPGRKLR